MRLAFTPAAQPADADIAAALASITTPVTNAPAEVGPVAPSAMPPAASETSASADAMPESELPTTIVHAAPSKGEGMPLLSVANAAALPIVEVPAAPLPEPPSEVIAIATPDEAAPGWAITAHPSVDPRDAVEAIPASAPPPPSNSTAALVWRAPTIERLPVRTAQAVGLCRDHAVLARCKRRGARQAR